MKIRYAHTNIIAEDWKALADFYITVFDCAFVPPERHIGGQWLADGTAVPNATLDGGHLLLPGQPENGVTLEIYSYQQHEDKGAPAANRLGFGHLAFEVEDVQVLLDKVIAEGGKKLGEIVHHPVEGVGDLTFTYCTDPDGNILELQHWEYAE